MTNRQGFYCRWFLHALTIAMVVLGSAANPAQAGLNGKVDRLSAKIFQRNLQQAQAGDAQAQLEVAHRLETGKGTTADAAQALAWYRKAAAQHIGEAQYRLGRMFETGTGTRQDLSQARQWYGKAAAQNYRPAAAAITRLEQAEQRARLKAEQEARARAERAAREKAREQARQKAQQQAAAQQALAAQRKARQREQARIREAKTASQPVHAKPSAPERDEPGRAQKAQVHPQYDVQQSLDLLQQGNWQSGRANVDFLPSPLSRCIRQGNRLSCFSDEREVLGGQHSIRYMAKSTIEAGDGGLVTIRYRYQVTRLRDARDDLEVHQGPDHPMAKTGWQSLYMYRCQLLTEQTLSCRNDNGRAFKLTRSVAAGVANSDIVQP